jgi:hypothetical protein
MGRRVRIFIQKDEVVDAPEEDESLSVGFGFERLAKNASAHFHNFSDIFLSPRS